VSRKKRFVGYYVIYVIHDPSKVKSGSLGKKNRPKVGCTVNYGRRCKHYDVDELEVIDLVSLACSDVFAGDVVGLASCDKSQSPKWREAIRKRSENPRWRKKHAEAMRRLAKDPVWREARLPNLHVSVLLSSTPAHIVPR
jgi:hypothetical protein